MSATAQPGRHATVYNLTVADLHTFYVLVDDPPTLVHNCARRVRTGGSRIYKSRQHAEAAARQAPATAAGAATVTSAQ